MQITKLHLEFMPDCCDLRLVGGGGLECWAVEYAVVRSIPDRVNVLFVVDFSRLAP